MSGKNDAVRFWLNTAGRWPLLPRDEMIRLGNVIQNPDTPEKARQRAVQKMVRHNLRLIPSIVRHIMSPKRSSRFGDTLTEDLLQTGVIGLHRAAEKFDPTLGYSFSTYAYLWIFQAVNREVGLNISMIQVPETSIQDYYKFVDSKNKNKLPEMKEKTKRRLVDAHAAINCMSLDSKPGNSTSDENDYHEYVRDKANEPAVYDDFDSLIKLVSLDERQLEVLTLLYRDGYTPKAACAALGIKKDKLRLSHKRGLSRLRAVIDR